MKQIYAIKQGLRSVTQKRSPKDVKSCRRTIEKYGISLYDGELGWQMTLKEDKRCQNTTKTAKKAILYNFSLGLNLSWFLFEKQLSVSNFTVFLLIVLRRSFAAFAVFHVILVVFRRLSSFVVRRISLSSSSCRLFGKIIDFWVIERTPLCVHKTLPLATARFLR